MSTLENMGWQTCRANATRNATIVANTIAGRSTAKLLIRAIAGLLCRNVTLTEIGYPVAFYSMTILVMLGST